MPRRRVAVIIQQAYGPTHSQYMRQNLSFYVKNLGDIIDAVMLGISTKKSHNF